MRVIASFDVIPSACHPIEMRAKLFRLSSKDGLASPTSDGCCSEIPDCAAEGQRVAAHSSEEAYKQSLGRAQQGPADSVKMVQLIFNSP